MKILHLTLKKKWFDMIASGEKKEEYREMKPYWDKRLVGKRYDAIQFRNGYAKDCPTMMIELNGIFSGWGITEWGASERETVYILMLGKILSIDNRGIDCEV
jgi:hypothetical protein